MAMENPRPWSVKESCFSRNSRLSCKIPRKLVPLEVPARSSRQTTLHLLSVGLLAMPHVGCTDPNTVERRRGFRNIGTNSATGRSFGSIIGRLIFVRLIDSFRGHEEAIAYPPLHVRALAG